METTIELHTIERGQGPLTLIFLHYFGGSAKEWQAVTEQLAAKYRCVAVDLRGHGDSPAPASGYSVDRVTDDLEATLGRLDIRSFVLIGHSMSGKIALNLASRQPVGLQQVLLVSPSPPHPEPIPDKDRKEMLDTHGTEQAAIKTFKNITAKPVSETDRQQIITDNLRTSQVAWDAWLTLGSKEDIADRMSHVVVPVSIIAGNKDNALSPDVQPDLTLPTLPDATFEVLDGSGHLPTYEMPDALTDFILKKIAGQRPTN
jgi:pimeloyl-ACP methyl ester carboxylesterase